MLNYGSFAIVAWNILLLVHAWKGATLTKLVKLRRGNLTLPTIRLDKTLPELLWHWNWLENIWPGAKAIFFKEPINKYQKICKSLHVSVPRTSLYSKAKYSCEEKKHLLISTKGDKTSESKRQDKKGAAGVGLVPLEESRLFQCRWEKKAPTTRLWLSHMMEGWLPRLTKVGSPSNKQN